MKQQPYFNLKLVIVLGMIVLISACASQTTFQNGKLLLEQGDYPAGFKTLKQATDEQPQNIEFKNYYYRQKDVWISKVLREGDTERINENWITAEERYQQVLLVEESNERAKDGLNAVINGQKNQALLLQAEDQFKSEDYDGARTKIRQILLVDPAHVKAKNLLSRIEQKKANGNNVFVKLKSKFKKPVSLEFRDARIKTVFELLSKSAGINFILDKEIRSDSTVSVFVKNTSIEEALNNILATAQLSKRVLNENSVLIYPNSKKGDYEEFVARTFYLQNADPRKVQELIKALVKTKDIFVDDTLKILVMKDRPEAIQMAEKLIEAYDLPDPEVLLEVEVLEVSGDKLSNIGLKFPSQLSVGVVGAGGTGGQLTLNEAKHFNSGFGQITITDPALVLSLRGTDSTNNILANPHIRVRNHKKAKVLIGDRVPVFTSTATSTGFVSESVTYLDVGLKLDVEPTVLIEDEVVIDVALEVSSITNQVTTKNGSLAYQLGTRNASTSLRLKNGETQVLAGLIRKEESVTSSQVPGLASLPIVGRLFTSKQDTRNKTEIVLLITPRIVRNIAAPDSSIMEFSMGTESGNAAPAMSNSGSAPSAPEPFQVVVPEVAVPPGQTGYEANPTQSLMPTPLNIPPAPPLPMTQQAVVPVVN